MLIGERYSNNLGDGIIFDTVESLCLKNHEKAEIISLDISGNKTYRCEGITKKKYSIRLRWLRKALSKYKRAIFLKKQLSEITDPANIDVAVFVGGQLFSSYFSKQILLISKYLNKHKVPIVFNCCGIGKNSKKSIKYLEKALNFDSVRAISIRDNEEYFSKKIKLKKSFEVTVDPVYDLDSIYSKSDIGAGGQKKQVVGIGLMEPVLYAHNNIGLLDKDYLDIARKIISCIEANGMEWSFFCNGNVEDFNYIKKICRLLGYSEEKIKKRPVYPAELIKIILGYDKIISFRLHSHIVARSFNIPTFGFVWDKKVKDFFSLFSDTNNCADLRDIDLESIYEQVDLFIRDKRRPKELFVSKRKKSSTFLAEQLWMGHHE